MNDVITAEDAVLIAFVALALAFLIELFWKPKGGKK